MTLSLPTADDLTRACDRLRPVVCRTPLLESSTLNAALGARVLVKAEALQHTGSFKFRGAYYRLSCLDERQRTAGVVAFSSGNFGRALAAAGSLLAIPVTIVMPVDAPRMKIDATRKCGAEVVLSEHGTRNREEAASELAANLARERGATLLHPFDDPLIVAGQGTTAVEMLEQIKQKQCAFDSLLVPVGGGGLISGCALAFANASSATEIYGVEPEGYDGMGRSIAVGKRARADGDRETLCDALQAVMPGEVPFRVARDRLKGAVAVADEPVRAAMALAFTELKIVLEPSGAIALGALLSGGLEIAGKCVGVVASGGNVAVERFKELVA